MLEHHNAALPLAEPGVYHENRDPRRHAEIALKFDAISGGIKLDGTTFSLAGFKTRTSPRSGVKELLRSKTDEIVLGEKRDFRLRIYLSGFICEVRVAAYFEDIEIQGDEEVWAFNFIAVDAEGREALRRIVRAYLSGYIPSPHDIAVAADPVTARASDAKAPQPAKGEGMSGRRLLNLAGVLGAACIFLGATAFAVLSLYENWFLVRASSATVTAPRIDVFSPAMGQLSMRVAVADGQVERDEVLFRIRSEELDADIEYAEARVAFYQSGTSLAEMPAAADELLQAEIDETLQTGSIPREITLDPAVSADVGESLPELNTGNDDREEESLAIGLLNSLQLRESALTEYSPCECVVSWALENGSWVKGGDPVVTLARTGADDLRIEALVNLKHANNLFVGQSAVVEMPGVNAMFEAEVEQISLDPTRQPRVGFPEWLRREPTLASVVLKTDEPLDPALIGTPIKVTLKLPVAFMPDLNGVLQRTRDAFSNAN